MHKVLGMLCSLEMLKRIMLNSDFLFNFVPKIKEI